MFLLKLQQTSLYNRQNLTFCVLKETLRKISSTSNVYMKSNIKPTTGSEEDTVEMLINKYESKLLYSSIIEDRRLKLGYTRNNAVMLKVERYNEKLKNNIASIQPLPLTLKYFTNINDKSKEAEEYSDAENKKSERVTNFPYRDSYHIDQQNLSEKEVFVDNGVGQEIRQRYELSKNFKNWMSAYDNFEHDLEDEFQNDNWKFNYGTPDPSSNISKVPCGGCGALLHCKDTAIPGYIPSEIFKNHWKKGAANLEAIICQRCYFLKEYNLALQVRVSPDDYPKVLTSIRDKKALVVLLVDLTDFPCSIWPGIADIFGPKTPIVIVGNKVDLLPSDGKHFSNRIKQNLLNHMKLCGFATCNILHTALISAKTGFGIEDLITSLHSLWKYKGLIPIPAKKFKCLQDLKKFCGEEAKSYFDNLPKH